MGSSRKYSLSSKSGTLLPEFPESSNLILPEGVSREKVYTFIMMYRTHCQRILDTVIGANFEEVQTFYLHFWQGMPDHLVEVLEASIITDIVGLCDSILYKVLIDVLVPSTIQDLPDSLNTEIKLFVKHLPYWLENSLEDVPKKLREKKLEVVKNFAHNMKRQMAFVHLAQTTRSVLLNHENVAQMVNDLAALDFNSICSQAAFTDDTFVQKEIGTICDFFNEFQDLLTKQAPIEAFTEWMDNLIDKCVIQPSKENNDAFRKKAGEFLRHWAVFGSLIMRDLTLQNAASFGSFHLLHMMFDEYVFLVIETQQATVDEHLLQKSVQKLMKNAGEISMQAKVRCVGKDKGKKRKMEDEPFIVQDASGAISGARTKHFLMPYPHLHGDVGTATAFTRPNTNTAFRETTPCYYGNDRLGSTHSQRATALKHYTSLSDRPYFPHHVTFGSFPDYSAQANTFATSFPQTFSDNHSYQPINSVHMQQYWNEAHARSHHHHAAFSDPYSYTGYGRFNSGYDAFAKTSPYLRSHATTFQDYNRNTFEDSRHFYGRPHDHGLAGTHFPVNHSYGASFMEIAPANNQDDVYALPAAPQLGMGGFHHTKSFIPTYR